MGDVLKDILRARLSQVSFENHVTMMRGPIHCQSLIGGITVAILPVSSKGPNTFNPYTHTEPPEEFVRRGLAVEFPPS